MKGSSKKQVKSAAPMGSIPKTASEVLSLLSPDRALAMKNLEAVIAFTKSRLQTAEANSELRYYLGETKSHAATALLIAGDTVKFWTAYDEILDDLRYIALLEKDSAAASA